MRLPTSSPASRKALLLPLVVALLLTGCAAGGLVNMWRDPAYPKSPLRKVFVIAVKHDLTQRRIMEDAFVAALDKRGVSARPSYRQFSNALPDTAQVANAVKETGYDGVLVASKLDTQTSTAYVPGYTTTEARTTFNRWTGRYQTYYTQVERPGYTETAEHVRHRVDLWSTEGDGRLVWTATGHSINPTSSDQVNREIVGEIVPELVRQGMIPKE